MEKRYKTHKWIDQHEELFSLFSTSRSEPATPRSKEFELIHHDFKECDFCHRMFDPKRIQGHSEHCVKTHQKSHKVDKLFTLSKSIQDSSRESLKSLNQSLKKEELGKKPRTP